MVPLWMLIGGGLLLVAIPVVFRSRQARLTALFTLLPLGALAAVIAQVGSVDREEATDLQTHVTEFGDGQHEAGASHAGGLSAEPTQHESAGRGAATDPLHSVLARAQAVPGLAWPDSPQRYNANSLWERINGGAEVYKEKGLRAALFATARSGDTDIEVQLYNMGSGQAANAMMSVLDRTPDAAPMPGTTGYTYKGGAEVITGGVYARIIISGVGDVDPVAHALAKAITVEPLTLGAAVERVLSLKRLSFSDKGSRYTANTLWDRINGGAEVFKKHGLRAAWFGSAKAEGAELEVQVYDQGAAKGSRAMFDETSRGAPGDAVAIGDRALLSEGAAQMQLGSLFVRAIIVSANPTDAANKLPAAVLTAIAGGSAETPAVHAPATATPAELLGIGSHLVKYYGITAAQSLDGGGVRATCSDSYRAVALASALGDEEVTVVFKGSIVLRLSGPDHAQRAQTAATKLEGTPPPGFEAIQKLVGAPDVALGGWSGKAALGPSLVGRNAAGWEVFVAAPPDPAAAIKELTTALGNLTVPDESGVVGGDDDYQGKVLMVVKDKLVVGIAGLANAAAARKTLLEVVLLATR